MACTPCRTSGPCALADRSRHRTGRPSRWATGLSIVVVVTVAITTILLSDGRREVESGAVRGAGSQAGAAAAVLGKLVRAVTEGDADTVDAVAVDDALNHLQPNAELLRVGNLEMRYVDAVGAVKADGSWVAEVEVSWRLEGADDGLARVPVLVEFKARGDDVLVGEIARRTAGGTRAPLWLRGPVSTARRDRVLVVVAGEGPDARARAQDLLGETRRAVATVRATLPDWDGGGVVEEASSADDLDAALGARAGTYAEIAAVTAAADGSTSSSAPVRIHLNPEVMAGMAPAGRAIVLAHELTHVATSAHRSIAAPWLVEGFADWVALRGADTPVRTLAGRAVEHAREHGLPDELPGADAFAADGSDLQVAYEQAWLACRVLARSVGVERFLAMREEVDRGRDTDATLVDAGMSHPDLVRRWRTELARLAGVA